MRMILWLVAALAYIQSLWLVTGKLYGLLFTALWNAEHDWLADTIFLALTTSTYVPAQDTHDYWDDVTNEITGTGYTANGQQLTNPSVLYTAGTNVHKLDADDVTWINSTLTARIAVLYNRTPASDATRGLIGYQDFISDKSSDNGDFKIEWDAAGIVEITVA